MTFEIDVGERNPRIAFQRVQELPEPYQIDIERRFDNAGIIIARGRAKSSYALTTHAVLDISPAISGQDATPL